MSTFPRPLLLLPYAPDADAWRDIAAAPVRAFIARLAAYCDVGHARSADTDGVIVSDGGAATEADIATERCDNLEHDGVRRRFLTLLFALARLRAVAAAESRAALVEFHAMYKYVLLAYDEAGMRELGRTVATVSTRPWEESVTRYRARFIEALREPAAIGGDVNALLHGFGHVTDVIGQADRRMFLESIDDLRAGRTGPAAPAAMLRAWAIRHGVGYIAAQAYVGPYPAVLCPDDVATVSDG